MATLSDITFYPVKSCAGLMMQQIYEREWMVVDAAGQFLTGLNDY